MCSVLAQGTFLKLAQMRFMFAPVVESGVINALMTGISFLFRGVKRYKIIWMDKMV